MGAYDCDYWKEPKKAQKRLKGIEEPFSGQVANPKKLDAVMREKYKTSKTYEHNQKVYEAMEIVDRVRKPFYIRALERLTKIFVFLWKCVIYFLIGGVVVLILSQLLH